MIDNRMKTLITLVESGSFSRTAEILNITQPAVSQHIKSLETEYKTTILTNRRKDLKLTPNGKIIFEYANELNRLSMILVNKLESEAEEVKRYNVGATMTIGGYVLPHILGLHKQKYPNVDIMFTVENTKDVVDKLCKGEIDLGVVEGPFDRAHIKYEKFRDDELILVTSPSHGFSSLGEVTIDMVLESKLILREKGSGTRRILEDELAVKGYKIKDQSVYMEIGSIQGLVSLVESNLGCTIISREAVKDSLKSGKLVEIKMKDFKIIREFNFVYFDESDFIDSFTEFCISKIQD